MTLDFTWEGKIDLHKPIQIPDEWITWEGKDEGRPKPPILWYGEFT